MVCWYERWDGNSSSPFIKDAPVHPLLNEVTQEALAHLSSVFGESDQLYTDASGSLLSVRKHCHEKSSLTASFLGDFVHVYV